MLEHKHPLNLIDLWAAQLQHEEEYEEEEEEDENADLTPKQNFQRSCDICVKNIEWVHRYCYKCSQCDYVSHKFCAELPKKLEDICHVGHTISVPRAYTIYNRATPCCSACSNEIRKLLYQCSRCYNFFVDAECATKMLGTNIIHHPSHKHPLVGITKQFLCECDACGKEHKGFYYHCTKCANYSYIHSDCAFLPKQLHIQHMTNDSFSHIHPLSIAYSFPNEDQKSNFYPLCRVCNKRFSNPRLWIYKCQECRYYTHLDCATSPGTGTGIGKNVKNYEDAQHPNLLHLPFPDPSYSILKHLFFKENECSVVEVTKRHTSHQHPLILEDARCTDVTRIKSISYHDPMKRIELLCDGCVRPITSKPVYMCANEDGHCNFVLHEWCTRLPPKIKGHPGHPQHTLVFHSKIPGEVFGVFYCCICYLHCNGFVYKCEECRSYYIDVNCAFLPEEITHASHPNHLLSRVEQNKYYHCRMCETGYNKFSFSCNTCDDFHLHPQCALLIPETTTHKCDKHPMKLRYFPAENHKSEYFCEICEDEFDPNYPFYHCHECMQSMHPACASSILQYETHANPPFDKRATKKLAIHEFINVKFGGTYNNIKVHSHPLSFRQGIARDGACDECRCSLQYEMIFECVNCEVAICYKCACYWSNNYRPRETYLE